MIAGEKTPSCIGVLMRIIGGLVLVLTVQIFVMHVLDLTQRVRALERLAGTLRTPSSWKEQAPIDWLIEHGPEARGKTADRPR